MATIMKVFYFAFLFLAAIATTGFEIKDRRNTDRGQFEFVLPTGLSAVEWRRRIPANNPMTLAKVELGQMLYFDKRLSIDGTVSCATCHDPANAFTDHNAIAVGVSNRGGTRNTPTILNAMFSDRLFWDGRAGSLEEQTKQPLTNSLEMGMENNPAVVARVSSVPGYQQRFKRVFGREGITIDTIAKAIAAFERTQVSANAPFDRFISGDATAITTAQKQGWELFRGKAKCIECHAFNADSPFFTDFKFHNTGIVAQNLSFERLTVLANQITDPSRKTQDSASLAHTRDVTELGRYLVTKQPEDVGAYKTPTLRDIELTTPYMHDGSIKTLIDVVRFYNGGGHANANLDERIRPLNLNEKELNDLVEFMRALTSDDVLRQTQSAKPQNRSAVH